MVTTQDDSASRKAVSIGCGKNEFSEICGLHAGVAAELVDLIHGGFDEQGKIVSFGLGHGCLNHAGMGAADRIDAPRFAAGRFIKYFKKHRLLNVIPE